MNECKTAKVTPKDGESGHWGAKGPNECDLSKVKAVLFLNCKGVKSESDHFGAK